MRVFLLAITFLWCVTAQDSEITCQDVSIPTLIAKLDRYKAARMCCPASSNVQEMFPLIFFQHGDGGGGAALVTYQALFDSIALTASACVVAPYSCAFDAECDNGQLSFLEVLKTEAFLRSHRDLNLPIDLSQPYSVAGHSTGARATLMLASLRDNPTYMQSYLKQNNVSLDIAQLQRFRSFFADFADPMYDPNQNPDIPGYVVTAPVFILTGTRDYIEPLDSGWKVFNMSRAPGVSKFFLNVDGIGHLEPIHPNGQREGPLIAIFARAFGLGERDKQQLFYQDDMSWLGLGIADKYARNSPAGPSYVSCPSEQFPTFC